MTFPISVELLLLLISVLLGVLMLNVLYLAYKKRQDAHGQKVKNAYIQEHELDWFDYFREGTEIPKVLVPKNRYEIEGIEEIFLVYIHNLKTPSIMEKMSQFANQYLYTHFKAELESTRWSRRMNAMERIVDFQLDRLVDECIRMDQEKLSVEEQFQRLKIIANLKEEDFLQHLHVTTHIFSEYAYKRIFMDLSENVFESLLKELDTLPLTCQYAVIDLVGLRRNLSLLPYLHEFLQHADAEVRIRALKAIHEIGVVIDVEQYKQFSDSDVWEERLMFTKLLAYAPSEVGYPYLRVLICDEAWWVRQQAGRVLKRYKNGTQLLQEIVETESDRYAVDTANVFLKEGDH